MTLKLPHLFLLALSAVLVTSARGQVVLKDQNDKISYSIGFNIGQGLKQQTQQQGLKLNPEIVAAGLKDILAGSKAALTDEEVHSVLATLQQELMGKQSQFAEKNKKAGEAFLAANQKKAGVKVLPNGLQYQVLTEGKGPKPKSTDTVKVNYRGTLIDGTEFDSSKQGPITFPLNRVIKGWTEGLQLMPVGSKYRLFIPSDLAYGEGGAGNLIGPGSTLVFEVELVGIEPAGAQ